MAFYTRLGYLTLNELPLHLSERTNILESSMEKRLNIDVLRIE